MLILQIHNDGSGDWSTGNYNYKVLVTETPQVLKELASGRVENWQRSKGFAKLIKKVAKALND